VSNYCGLKGVDREKEQLQNADYKRYRPRSPSHTDSVAEKIFLCATDCQGPVVERVGHPAVTTRDQPSQTISFQSGNKTGIHRSSLRQVAVGKSRCPTVGGGRTMNDSDIVQTVKPIIAVFDRLGISYYIGGSVASSAFGMARSTLDVDVVAQMGDAEVRPLVEGLKDVFYVSETAVFQAVRNRTSFNVVHLETMLKVDVFVLKQREYDQQAFERRRKEYLDTESQDATVFFSSPEDIILNKLEWFKTGGEVSERQWGDILGVIKVQSEELNKEYLRTWATKLGVSRLLEKAFAEGSP
jgi:hypothetical protein